MVHDPAFARYVGDLDFGQNALLDFNSEMFRWYDYWLNDTDTGVMSEPRVHYFLMGANEWRTADSLPSGPSQAWYLQGRRSGTARSLNDGSLSPVGAGAQDRPDRFRYNPARPVPTIGGNTLYAGRRDGGPAEEAPNFALTAGPRDQRSVEPLCLTYTSGVLETDLYVVGWVGLFLWVSSSCVDTDFVAKLCDVFPDGRSILVADGIQRARYRGSARYPGRWYPRLLKPGKIHFLGISLGSTAWRFVAGHRLRLAITSSNFPRFDLNLNTGVSAAVSSAMKVATNTVYHDKKHPSYLHLPVLS
jgi:putative CocE/NonD family hydrolase